MTKPVLPFSASAARNTAPIAIELGDILAEDAEILEVGSGTGQHAVAFAQRHPGWQWHPSDLEANQDGLIAQFEKAGLANIAAFQTLDVTSSDWPQGPFDALYTANTFHIMPKSAVAAFFKGARQVLKKAGHVIVYGPFNYNGQFTSDGNQAFDASLRQGNPVMGIRDFEWINGLAESCGLALTDDRAMPANNRLLVYLREY